jgi:hypothetical protein
MHKFRPAIALAISLAMAGCQTLDGIKVNGREWNSDVQKAQAAEYGWLWVAGAIAAGALIWILVDDDDDDDDIDIVTPPPVVNPLGG